MPIWRLVACWISRTTRAQERTRDRASTPTPTYKHIHARTRTYPREYTHSHTLICNTYCFATAAIISKTLLNITFVAFSYGGNK